jgi:hypothetical protein
MFTPNRPLRDAIVAPPSCALVPAGVAAAAGPSLWFALSDFVWIDSMLIKLLTFCLCWSALQWIFLLPYF